MSIVLLKKGFENIFCKVVLQIRADQRSITANLWPLTTHIFHVMIIVTGDFSNKCFFIIFISCRTQVFFKTAVVRNVAIFIGKHLCWSPVLIKLPYGLQLYFNLVPKETSTQVFSWEYYKIFSNNFFIIELLQWILL